MFFVVELLVLGVGVGLISGALGLGGGILMIPAFLAFIPQMDVHTAKGTSLFIILFVAAVNAWQLNRNAAAVPWALAFRLASGAIVGSYLGAWITTLLPEFVVIALFTALLLGMAWQLFGHAARPQPKPGLRRWWFASPLIGAYSGAAGGATGTGGGLILVPLALQTGLVTNKNATAVSNMVMVAIAIAGSIAHLRAHPHSPMPWTYGQVSLYVVPWVFAGAQAGAYAGRKLNHRITLRQRRVTLGVLLLLIVASLLYRSV